MKVSHKVLLISGLSLVSASSVACFTASMVKLADYNAKHDEQAKQKAKDLAQRCRSISELFGALRLMIQQKKIMTRRPR